MSFEQSDLGNTSRLYAQPTVRMNLWLLGDETKEFTKWSEHRRTQEATQDESLSKHRGRELMAGLWGRWSNTYPPAVLHQLPRNNFAAAVYRDAQNREKSFSTTNNPNGISFRNRYLYPFRTQKRLFGRKNNSQNFKKHWCGDTTRTRKMYWTLKRWWFFT